MPENYFRQGHSFLLTGKNGERMNEALGLDRHTVPSFEQPAAVNCRRRSTFHGGFYAAYQALVSGFSRL